MITTPPVTSVSDDLVRRLSEFGLTVNQARVYLSIVLLGLKSAGEISKSSQLHRQDIYKVLPVLEKKGLIIRLVGKPSTFEAFPVASALANLVAGQEEKAKKRISDLKRSIKEVVEIIRTHQEINHEPQEEARFILLSTDAQMANVADLMFKNVKKEFDLVTSDMLLERRETHFRDNFQKISRRGVKIRLILESLEGEFEARKLLDKIRPRKGNFNAKLLHKTSIPYKIVDGQDLWIRRRKLSESGLPCILWTNAKSLLDFYKENFEEAWNNPAAISLYPQRVRPPRRRLETVL